MNHVGLLVSWPPHFQYDTGPLVILFCFYHRIVHVCATDTGKMVRV